jgi:hypothetical protein
MLQADYQMRDMAGSVHDAYTRADQALEQQRLAQTGAAMSNLLERQRQFSMPMLRPNFTGMIAREAAWRDIGTAPGISYDDLARAGQDVDAAKTAPDLEQPETKAPENFGQPKAEPEEPAAEAAAPVAPVKPVEKKAEAAPAVDMTGWHPDEKAEYMAAQDGVEKAGLYQQALEQAASCLMEAAG